jgi:hypothetical protein
LSTDKCNGFNCHILHPWLHKVLPQTTNAARNRTQTHPRLSPIFIAACIDIVYNIIILSYAKITYLKSCIIYICGGVLNYLINSAVPDSMARTTYNIFDPQVSGSGTDRDTIITGSDLRVQDCDAAR